MIQLLDHRALPELKTPKSLAVRIVTPGGIFWQGQAQSVTLPSKDGEMGILKGHVAVTAILDVGVLWLRSNGKVFFFSVQKGFAQVEADQVIVIVNQAELGNEINPEQAQYSLEIAANNCHLAVSLPDKIQAKRALKLAQVRLKAAQGLR
ncbi:MAG: ATP synthase F1 subunit epsilon [Gomphosphaeria aponina SAG 52.96 = DSM 107014]|uniref:ATP synthase epsilon chain n=1 Tax=Gomphosphaeria aponina SAG 52.96 = DSM 107014 TaxID=1521640 RepID=A0A941JTI4_9CHRO|nr:ATP synthase F1 subunit epsilon [Gomphosphaeria aponina SAG 52.96 = DSM 107014]